MKEGWEYKKLGEVCGKCSNIKWDDVSNEASYRYIDLTSVDRGDLHIHNPQNIRKDNAPSRAKQIIKAGDVIFATTRPTLRRVSIIEEQYDGDICSTGFCVLRHNEVVKSRFVFYALLYDGFYKYIEPLQTGANYPAVTDNVVKNYIIPVPPLPEQQRIVDYLDSAFAKIDAMKANAEKSLNEAKALFQASLKEMLEPKEGWEEKILQDICSDIVDCPHTTPQKVGFPTQYPCIRTSELKGGRIDWSTMQYLDEDEYKKRVSRLVPKANDLVYGREGTYGDAVLLPDGYSFSLGQRTMLLRPNEIYIIPRFLLYSMISPHVYQQAKAKNSGCGVGHVNVKDIKVFRIGLPTIDIQQSIVDTLDSLKSKVDRLQENYNKISQECDALKQAILRQVFE